MAESKAKKTATKVADTKKNDDIVIPVEFTDEDLDKSVVIHNIAGWDVTFALRNRVGDVLMTKKSKQRLQRNEIQSQIYNGNKLFCFHLHSPPHYNVYFSFNVMIYFISFYAVTPILP